MNRIMPFLARQAPLCPIPTTCINYKVFPSQIFMKSWLPQTNNVTLLHQYALRTYIERWLHLFRQSIHRMVQLTMYTVCHIEHPTCVNISWQILTAYLNDDYTRISIPAGSFNPEDLHLIPFTSSGFAHLCFFLFSLSLFVFGWSDAVHDSRWDDAM